MNRVAMAVARSASAAVVALALVMPASALAAAPTIDEISAQTVLGDPVSFSATVHADAEPQVELLMHLPADPATYIVAADLSRAADGWTATATLDGHVVPNTRIDYQFRVTGADGTTVLSPAESATTSDERFDWQTISGPVVRLHWYSGSQAFAEHALDIGETAIAQASDLLGVTETEPVDFFIYDNEREFRVALGPGTRENVGGEAHTDIRTLFALITPADVGADWVDSVVTHELTHLVFNTATDNLYHAPPRWLNEGIAVYLSEGYTQSWQSVVRSAVSANRLIPLDGLAGFFPTSYSSFSLAYGESVSAIDYFISRFGDQTLWDLVRSYADGVSDDAAFRAATGDDVAAFNKSWLESLGATVPEPYGPQPAPRGPVPADWLGQPSPGQSGAPVVSAAPTPIPTPSQPAAGLEGPPAELLLAALMVILVVAAPLVLWARRRRPDQPDQPDQRRWWQ